MRAVRCSFAVFIAAFAMMLGFGCLTTAASAAKLKAAPKITAKATYTARGSVGEAYVTGATSGDQLMLVNKAKGIVRTGTADSYGSKIFFMVKPDAGYTVRLKKDGKVYGSKPFRILKAGANPPNSFYENKPLHEGLNYVKMRDGVELAMTVRLPASKDIDDGPFPTFIEYSGYQVAAPHDLLNSVIGSLGGGGGPSDPLAPSTSTAVGSLLGPLMDFATVSVQMRGSGCSGGSFDLFGLPTTYDGYDAVETVGNQSWVKNGKVGMGGISFSGITQLFTAGTQPPHLAAVAPMSVTDDVYTATGYPGGIFNKGFALSWITQRMNDAKPAPADGQDYAKVLTTTGDPQTNPPNVIDQHCLDNQKLRLQTRDANVLIEKHPYRDPSLFAARAPGAWVKNIEVPIFWVGQYQDEQTGGHFPESMGALAKNKNVWISMQNGVHVDSLGPSTITHWAEFMKLFVADEIPEIPAFILGLSGSLYDYLADAGSVPVAQSELADSPSVAAAKAEFRASNPRVRLLMDNGDAVPGDPGAIGAKWELDYNSWPIKQAKPVTYFLQKGGALGGKKAAKPSSDKYVADPSARPPQTLIGAGESDAWKAQPPYNWAPLAAGKGLGWTSGALSKDAILAGTSSLDLYVKSSAKDTDFQVTLSEVRPDGKETFVQNGWLRASHRALNKKLSTVNDPKPTHLSSDAAPMPKNKFALVRIPIFPVAHAFRAGSKIRVTVQATGGDRPIWDFDTVDDGTTTNTVLFGAKKPSRLVVPIVSGATALGTPLPVATALRGQPSRTYSTASNGG